MLFRETRPRKSKFGFAASLSNNIFELGPLVKSVMMDIPEGDKWWSDTIINMGQGEVKIYINDEDLYEAFKEANELT